MPWSIPKLLVIPLYSVHTRGTAQTGRMTIPPKSTACNVKFPLSLPFRLHVSLRLSPAYSDRGAFLVPRRRHAFNWEQDPSVSADPAYKAGDTCATDSRFGTKVGLSESSRSRMYEKTTAKAAESHSAPAELTMLRPSATGSEKQYFASSGADQPRLPAWFTVLA
ncbi:hypothetical protein C8F04DRAFT_66589 [Mycena alexandri]|uniref:Uncharacterized protein n=1 Tax=Mycena alexandri TaxID=1745969 RepID=A0AAD6SIQ0_9AGAR|nr:hypothetical protein C8F04DRAFT_66589 [Mycena alexandri]